MTEYDGPTAKDRRPPTAAEARALAHPLRLRILFACRERARTNKELAEALDTTPGTIHYHLKPLVEESFLRAEEPQPGPRGSTLQPYRSTGKSWGLSGTPEDSRILREVGADELLQAQDVDMVTLARLGLTLPAAEVEELRDRLGELAEEFAARSLTGPLGDADASGPVARTRTGGPDGQQEADEQQEAAVELESVTLFFSIHRSPGRT